MRTTFFLACALAAGATGCKWTDFDDLEGQTWVRSTQDPEIGANDYAVAIAGVETGAAGGTLVVISDDTPNYSTLEYAVDGSAEVGTNPSPIKLTSQSIGSIAEQPVFAVDANNAKLALVERSTNGSNFSVLFGSPTAPAGLEPMSMDTPTPQPDAAAFVGGALVFAAGSRIYRLPETGGGSMSCTLVDHANMPVQIAGMGHHLPNLIVWTKAGTVLSYLAIGLESCGGATLAPTAGEITMSGFMPASGARVHIVGTHAVLAGKAATSRIGQIYVIDLTTFTTVGTALALEGMRSSVVADFGGTTYLAAGIPDRSVQGVVAGVVELYELNTSTGVLAETPVVTLHDADPESGQQFGRTVAAMSFRGDPVLVVGTATEIFTYFRTAVYDHLP